MNEDLHKLANELRTMRFDPVPVMDVTGTPNQLDWPRDNKPEFAGVYAFWWKRGRDHLWKTMQNRTVPFHAWAAWTGS